MLAGLALTIGLIAWQGFGAVLAVLEQGGKLLFWLAPAYMIYSLLDTMAWQKLLSRGSCRFVSLYFTNWIGNSINWLLPVGQVGGDAIRARLLLHYGVRGAEAGACIIVDKTLQVVTLVFYALIGLALLALHAGNVPVSEGVLAFALMLTLGIYVFYRLQLKGIFSFFLRFNRSDTPAGRFTQLADGATALDTAIISLYEKRWWLLASLLWRMLFRFAMAGEVYMALYFLGQPVGFIECIILQSLGQAVRAAGFLVPGALGIQEGGYLVLGMALGLGAEFGLALSLAKRLRELVVGIPGLVSWHLYETRYWSRGGTNRRSP